MVKLRFPNQTEIEIPNGTTIAQLAAEQENRVRWQGES